jgi:putative methyltransferase (TIGR04325 family)
MRLFNLNLAGISLRLNISRQPSSLQAQRSIEEYAEAHVIWEGEFSNWDEALNHASGYDSPVIIERAIAATRAVENGSAVWERDTVLFDKIEIAYPLLTGLLYAGSRNGQRLAVMDVGGALGTSYRQNKAFLAHLNKVIWGVVEQESFVRAGQKEFQTDALGFFPSVEACVQKLQPNFLLLSGVLQCLRKPYDILVDLLSLDIPFVFVDRTMAHRFGCDRLVVQRVPPKIYAASYPVWLLDADRLESVFSSKGYEILYHFDPHPGSTFGPPDFSAPYVGWFLRKKSHFSP